MALERTFKLTFLGDAKKALGEMDKLGGGLDGMTGKAKAAAAGITAAAAGGVVASIKMAVDFESQFAEVATLLPAASSQALKGLQQDIIDTSNAFGFATSEVIPAYYDAISSGQSAESAGEFMKVAAELAIAGVTELQTSVGVLSAVTNAYKSSGLEAGTAADIIFTTMKNGTTTVDQLAASLANVTQIAGPMGVPFEEVAASVAKLTLGGIETSVATTMLKSLYNEAGKGNSKVSAAIKELNGLSFTELIDSGVGAAEILQNLRETMPDQAFRDLWGSVEAGGAALALTGDEWEAFNKILGETETAAGSTHEGFETIADTDAYKFKVAMNQLKNSMLQFGLIALPVVSKLLDAFTSMSPGMRKVIMVVGAVVVAISVLVTVLGPLVGIIGAVIGFIMGPAGLTAALTFLATNPIGWVILGIAALIAAGVLLYKNWDTVKEKAGALAGWLTDKLGGVLEWVAGHWPEIATLIAGPFGPLVALATDAFGLRSALTDAFGAILSVIIGIVGGAVTQIQRLIDKIAELFAMAADLPGKLGDALNPLPGNAGGGLLGSAVRSGLEAIVPGMAGVNSARRLMGFASGGVVPGPTGAARMVMAHGGETILPTHRAGYSAGTTINVSITGGTIIGNSAEFERTIVRALNTARAKGGF